MKIYCPYSVIWFVPTDKVIEAHVLFYNTFSLGISNTKKGLLLKPGPDHPLIVTAFKIEDGKVIRLDDSEGEEAEMWYEVGVDSVFTNLPAQQAINLGKILANQPLQELLE